MKKVLIITYYWPPAGGPGVQRWLKFVKYLPDFGIEPIVFIPENPTYPIQDKSLFEEVSPNLKVIKQPIFEPYKFANLIAKKKTNQFSSGIIDPQKEQTFLQKTMLSIRGNLFIPDARKFWINPSTKFLKSYVKKHQINTIITTGPPHSVHLIGLKLKQKLNLKWIADFRDPWTKISYHKRLRLSKYSQKRHRQLEATVLKNTNHIITTSCKTKQDFKKITNQPITVITNGYDIYYKKNTQTLDNTFTLSHIGNLLSGRNPENLWIALSELIEEYPKIKSQLKIQFIGKLSDETVQSLNLNKLAPYIKIIDYVPHKKAIEYQKKSQILLLIEVDSKETREIIPGKLFEYLNAKRPILAIGPKDWEVKKIIEETNSGFCFSFQDKKEIKSVLLTFFKAYQKGKLTVDSKNIAQYHRKNLTKNLSEIIKSL